MKNNATMDNGFLKFLSDIGIDYKYVLNGFIGAIIWSIYKKLKFWDAVRQVFIGSVVAGYVTPLIAYKENIPITYVSALSFIVGMMGLVIVDSIYKYIVNKIKIFKRGKKASLETEIETEE